MDNENKKLISQDTLHDIIENYLKPKLDQCKARDGMCSYYSKTGGFHWTLASEVGCCCQNISVTFEGDHWEIHNDRLIREHVNIKVYPERVEFIEESCFNDFDRDFMYGLYLKIKEYIEDIKEENTMGVQNENNNENKKLISQEELKAVIYFYLGPKMREILSVMRERFSEDKKWKYDHSDGFFIWGLWDDLGRREHCIAAKLFDDNQWCIYTNGHHGESINIIVYSDHVEFIEDSVFIADSFDKECMHDLYMKIKSHMEKYPVNNQTGEENDKEEKKEDNDKELLSDDEAFKSLLEWLYDYEKLLKEYLDPVRKRLRNMPIFEEEENTMGVQNENNNEGSKFESAMNHYEGDTTKHRKSDEWDRMRAMVNGSNILDKIDLDKIKINIAHDRKTINQCRPSKDNYYLNIAKEVAQRGTCLRRKFGAVIVNNDEIVSTGYAGAPRGRVNCIDRGVCFRQENNVTPGTRYELCRSVHAEMNAVISAGRDRCIGATLYLVGIENDGSFTSNADCCSMCKRVIINAGIEKVVFRTPLGQRTIHVKEDWINDDDSLTIREGY